MSKQKLFDTSPQRPKVVLVGAILHGQKKTYAQAHINELASLADTAGMDVLETFIQKLDQPEASTLIRRGKVEEIRDFVSKHPIQRVIFDDELTPAQTRNLEKALQCEVWDRSLLILDIFAIHARTPQAKAQVELAQYQYLLPRLVGMWTHLSRQQGGSRTMRGPGEKELETDRRAAQHRIRLLKERLTKMEQTNKTQRKQRHKRMNITLVGYTNAGKSSLMQCLAKEDVLIEDKLFATLSPTVRQVVINNHVFLLADTVGFIHKLPHTLVECFKSTLAEVREADLLLHVVDFSHPHYEHHIDVVQRVLQEIEASCVPTMLVLNKQDLAIAKYKKATPQPEIVDEKVFLESEKQRLAHRYNLPVVCCSALQRVGIAALTNTLYRLLIEQKLLKWPRSSMDRTKVS